MAGWATTINNWTPVAVADTTAFTNAGYHALQGGTSTQSLMVYDIWMSGLAGSSSPAQMIFARDSTVGATALTGATLAAMNPATANLAANPVGFNSSTTKPQRSSTLYLLTPAFNAFGGIVRWRTDPDGQDGFFVLGNTASFGEVSLSSASTGTPGLMASTFLFNTV